MTEFRLFLQLVESLTLLTAAAKTSRRGCNLAAAPNLLSGSGAVPSPDRQLQAARRFALSAGPGVPEVLSLPPRRHSQSDRLKATGSLPREVPVSRRLGGRAATECLTSDASSDASSALCMKRQRRTVVQSKRRGRDGGVPSVGARVFDGVRPNGSPDAMPTALRGHGRPGAMPLLSGSLAYKQKQAAQSSPPVRGAVP